MGKIRLLDERTINQIAAGEVVENAASIVKELVENSLDAGSTEIEVAFSAGGRQLIRVADNGRGMGREDALMALERHATSKIQEASDLSHLNTMGFRGEALPSIGAVSKMKITTAEAQGDAFCVQVEGGKVAKGGVAARDQGTTIEVGSLFYNTPVRKKFQKSVNADTADLTRLFTQLALANPEVRFTLRNGEKELFSLPPSEPKQRATELLGREFSGGFVPVSGRGITGFVGKATHTRASRGGQYLFINRRPVFSRLVSEAVREAYGTRLPTGRHPVFVLYIDLSGEEVDVNVHPQKREVRFSGETELKRRIIEAVSSALIEKSAPLPVSLPWEDESVERPVTYERVEYNEAVLGPALKVEETVVQPMMVEEPIRVVGQYGDHLLVDGATLPIQWREEGLFAFDAPRCAARIEFEKVMSDGEIASQTLLIPVTVDLLSHEAAVIEENLEELQRIGLGIRPFGGTTFVVDALPVFLGVGDVARLVADLATSLKGLEAERRKKVAIVTSQIASRGGYSAAAGELLLKQLFKCEDPLHSPLGKPLSTRIKL